MIGPRWSLALACLTLVVVCACGGPTDTRLGIDGHAERSSSSHTFTRVQVFYDLGTLVAASPLVVVGVAGPQEPMPNYPLPVTLTQVTVSEVLVGDAIAGSVVPVMEMGRTAARDVFERTAAPMESGSTYVLFLQDLGYFQGKDGSMVEADEIRSAVLPGRYLVKGDQLVRDLGVDPDDELPAVITRAELDQAVAATR